MLTNELVNQRLPLLAQWRDYYTLTKPRVVQLLVFTAVVGMFLATPGMVPWDVLLFGSLGIGLAAASGAAVNHVVDQRVDAQMTRTRGRPLPTGRVSDRDAFIFALLLGVVGLGLLTVAINPLTAVLTFLSLIGYAVVYTIFLKRATPQNIVIGGAAGAAPPLLGWTAVTNEVSFDALLLFLIIFTWTPPHFWALAIARKDDYAKAGVPMLPVTHGIEVTKAFVLCYTVLLVNVTLLPYFTGMSGLLYLFGAVTLGAGLPLLRHSPKAIGAHRRRNEDIRLFDHLPDGLVQLFAAGSLRPDDLVRLVASGLWQRIR